MRRLLPLLVLLLATAAHAEYRPIKIVLDDDGDQYLRIITWHQLWLRYTEFNPGTAIDPSGLKLELTESVILDDVDEAVTRMDQLRELGVRFSLDDFGTGYSSLARLKRLPVDKLKLDQSFVRGLPDDPEDAEAAAQALEDTEQPYKKPH